MDNMDVVVGNVKVRSCDMRVEPNAAKQIFALVEKAFENEVHSDHREQFLVEKLYNSPTEEGTFIPELSLVAELGEEIIGFSLLTKCFLVLSSSTDNSTANQQQQSSSSAVLQTNNNPSSLQVENQELKVSLALAPLAIKPQYQNMGIGSLLMRESHKRAKELDFTSVVLVGHENYYPRFGYRMMKEFGISVPYVGIPDMNCMAVELEEGCLSLDPRVKGSLVQYAKEFSNY